MMVKDAVQGGWARRTIDIVGGGLTVVCLSVFAWMMFLRTDRTSAVIGDLKADVRLAKERLAGLQPELTRLRVVVEDRRLRLDETGELPSLPPVEAYFQTLSELANRCALRVLRHSPLSPRSYPGLMEQRFLYEVSGTGPNLLRFFKAVEESDYWADIGYLSIEGGASATAPASLRSEPVARLTISLFSTLPGQGSTDTG